MPWYVYVCELIGLGQLPIAPGTWGSLGATILYAGLYMVCPVWLLAVFTVLILVGSIPLCNWASLYMAQHDPSNVVLDELVGQWIALFPGVWIVSWDGSLLGAFVTGFLIFRVFDVLNVFPVNVIEKLPGGWGIVFDDVMAGIYANLILHLITIYNLRSLVI